MPGPWTAWPVVVDRHATRLAGLSERLAGGAFPAARRGPGRGARLEDLRREAGGHRVPARPRPATRLQKLALEMAESGVRQESAVEALRRELGCEPETAMAAACPALPEGVDAASRAAAVETELASLGPVNPLALEELGTLEERHRFLEEQVEDVRRARRELHQVIRAVDDEIMRVFAEAFADVNEHFQVLVGALFPGGTGRLVAHRRRPTCSTPASRSRPARRARTSANCRFFPAASGPWWPWPSSSPSSAAGPRPST